MNEATDGMEATIATTDALYVVVVVIALIASGIFVFILTRQNTQVGL